MWYIRSVLELTRREAGLLMQAAQGLLDPPRGPAGLADLRATVDRLGAVQIDTISVVQRSQYLVLWSRLGSYDPSLLDRLLHPERATFEYWGHAASILPMADYAYFRPRMVRHRDHMWVGLVRWMEANPTLLADTLARVREQGPLSSAQFECPPDAKRHGPWDWYGPKASRRALEALYTMGELMVHSRRGGQKLYDLRERVLAEAFPDGAPSDDGLPPEDERRRHFAVRTLAALGVVTPGWLHDYFRLAPSGKRRAEATALLEALVARGRAVTAAVEGLREPAYVAAERLADLERLRGGGDAPRTTLLSPFDSLIWHRERARALFDYEVCFEAYVVPEKRRYGYYCLAILHRGRIVGRADLKSDRAAGQLRARGLWLEPGVEVDGGLVGGLAGALKDLARFVGLGAVALERAEPSGLAPRLAEQLA
jgi:uncharacterized protein YcaQ